MSAITIKSGHLKNKYKKWFKPQKDDDELPEVTEQFIDILEKSKERRCNCENSLPFVEKTVNKKGKIKERFICKKCNSLYYKYNDFSFASLIMGMKRSGKTTLVMMLSDVIHRIDPQRKIAIWQCPDGIIDALYEVKFCRKYWTICKRAMGEESWSNLTPKIEVEGKNGSRIQAPYQKKEIKFRCCEFTQHKNSDDCKKCKYYQDGLRQFRKIDKFKEIQNNDIIVIDEAIISTNAKEALTKKMRKWDKLLAILGHKRLILFALFQRSEIIKSLREMSDMIIYKRLPQRIINEEKRDKFMLHYKDKILHLEKWEAIINSDLFGFDKQGLLITKVPEWYNEDISEAWSNEMDFLDDTSEEMEQLENARSMAQYLIEEGHMVDKSNEKLGAKGFLRYHFPQATTKELNLAIEQYFSMMDYEGQNQQSEQEFIDDTLKDQEIAFVLQDLGYNLDKKDLGIFWHYCHGWKMDDFDVAPYHEKKQRVSEIIPKVATALMTALTKKVKKIKGKGEGDEAEQRMKLEAWDNGGFAVRTVGSGGERGAVPSPDLIEITKDGHVRPVQVKERDSEGKDHFTLRPASLNSELRISNRLKTIAYQTEITCPYCLERIKGKKVGGILKPDDAYLYACEKNDETSVIKERIKLNDNKMTLNVNWSNKKVYRQTPDISRITNPDLLEFLKSDEKLMKKNLNVDDGTLTDEHKKLTDTELQDIVSIDDIYVESEE